MENKTKELADTYLEINKYDIKIYPKETIIRNCIECGYDSRQTDIDELVNSIESAMRIANIWAIDYANLNVQECNIGEVAALSMMRQKFEILIQKHK